MRLESYSQSTHSSWGEGHLNKTKGRRRRRRDGWMASLTQWRWVWANSGRWLRTGKTGMLQSMGLQRVGHDWMTEQQQQQKDNRIVEIRRTLTALNSRGEGRCFGQGLRGDSLAKKGGRTFQSERSQKQKQGIRKTYFKENTSKNWEGARTRGNLSGKELGLNILGLRSNWKILLLLVGPF